MIERFKLSENGFFLILNGIHSPFWDGVMGIVTHRFTWIPLYIYLIYYLFRNFSSNKWLNLIFVLLSVGLADRITSGLMKPFFERFRPCHDPAISQWVHVVGNCGGQFGFASSHAANSFALVLCFYLLLKMNHLKNQKLIYLLSFWAILVSYSRIYVGVHFPSDIVVGALVGSIIPIILVYFFQFFKK